MNTIIAIPITTRGLLRTRCRAIKSDGSCGRELDFITQEINREINTIGSKVPDLSVAENVITVKTYLERIREQVRNIE